MKNSKAMAKSKGRGAGHHSFPDFPLTTVTRELGSSDIAKKDLLLGVDL